MNFLPRLGICAIILLALLMAGCSTTLSRLQSGDPGVREAAASELTAKGEQALPRIKKWLKSQDEKTVIAACLVLEQAKDDLLEKVLPELGEILDEDISARTLAAAAVIYKHNAPWQMVYEKRKNCLRNINYYILTEGKGEFAPTWAAEALVWMQTPRVTEALMEALRNDKSYDVREVAAYALGLNLDPAAVPLLIEVLENKADICEADDFFSSSKDVRVAAAASLSMIGDTRATDALLRTIQKKTVEGENRFDEVRYVARRAIVDICDPRAFDTMVRMLESQEQRNRYCAVRYLRELGDARAVKPLMTLIEHTLDPDYFESIYHGCFGFDYDFTEDILHEAFWALAEIGDKTAAEPLIQLVRNIDADEPVDIFHLDMTVVTAEILALKTLGKLGDERAIKLLVEQFKDECDALSAVEALLEIGTPAATSTAKKKILEMTKLKDDIPDFEAIKAFAKVDRPAAIAMLTNILEKSQVKGVKYYAAETLGVLGEPKAAQTLRVILLDEKISVKRTAITALVQIGDKRAVDILAERLRNAGDVQDKLMVARALALIGDQRPAGQLLKLFEALSAEREKEPGCIASYEDQPVEMVATLLGKFPTPAIVRALEREKKYYNKREKFVLAWIRGGKDLELAPNSVKKYKDRFQDYARARWGDLSAIHNVIMGFHERTDPSGFDWKDELFAPDIFSRLPEGFPEYDRKAPFDTKVRQAKAIRTWYRKHKERLAWDEANRRYYLRKNCR